MHIYIPCAILLQARAASCDLWTEVIDLGLLNWFLLPSIHVYPAAEQTLSIGILNPRDWSCDI